MAEIDFYIYVLIALLGIAYPLLFQVIARLEEKYFSENIVWLFDKEFEGIAFKYLLFSSLVFAVIWSLRFEAKIQIEDFNFLINNSAAILLSLNIIALVIVFFFFVRKILIYYTPTKFVQYLRSKHSKKSKHKLKYFEALSDMLLLSIRTKQVKLSLTISDFIYSVFRVEREKQRNKPVVYPDLYYEIVYESIEELAILKEKRNYPLEYSTAGGTWLLGGIQGSEISEQTYRWMWRNILLMTQYKQENMIVYHWETAHQFYVYSLQSILADYNYTEGTFEVRNENEVKKRNKERAKFIEFHYALGGLLVYKQMYSCIKRLFDHTNSQPPKYELLPESMNEIFRFYFLISDPYDRNYAWINSVSPPKSRIG